MEFFNNNETMNICILVYMPEYKVIHIFNKDFLSSLNIQNIDEIENI
jgi:hypothetical protein